MVLWMMPRWCLVGPGERLLPVWSTKSKLNQRKLLHTVYKASYFHWHVIWSVSLCLLFCSNPRRFLGWQTGIVGSTPFIGGGSNCAPNLAAQGDYFWLDPFQTCPASLHDFMNPDWVLNLLYLHLTMLWLQPCPTSVNGTHGHWSIIFDQLSWQFAY